MNRVRLCRTCQSVMTKNPGVQEMWCNATGCSMHHVTIKFKTGAIPIAKKEIQMKKMTIEEAIKLVTDYAAEQYIPPTEWHKLKLIEAAEILRNMAEKPVVKKSTASGYKCIECGHLHSPCGNCPSCGKSSYTALTFRGKKTWKETRILKIVKQKTDVKFEEVD